MAAHKELLGCLPDVIAQSSHRSVGIARADRVHKFLVFGGDVTRCAPKRHRPATVEFRGIAQRLGNRHQAWIRAPLEQRLMKHLVGPRPVVGDALGILGIHLGRALQLVMGRYDARLPAKVSMLDGQANHDRLDLVPRLGQMLQISDGYRLDAKALLRHRFDQAFGDQAGNCFTYDPHAGPVIIRQCLESQLTAGPAPTSEDIGSQLGVYPLDLGRKLRLCHRFSTAESKFSINVEIYTLGKTNAPSYPRCQRLPRRGDFLSTPRLMCRVDGAEWLPPVLGGVTGRSTRNTSAPRRFNVKPRRP